MKVSPVGLATARKVVVVTGVVVVVGLVVVVVILLVVVVVVVVVGKVEIVTVVRGIDVLVPVPWIRDVGILDRKVVTVTENTSTKL